jgi:iron complex transport system substrate-binding protein
MLIGEGNHMRRVAILLLALPTLLLGACSDDGGDEPATGGDTPAAEEGGASIEHVYGTTELDSAPQRIVSLDLQWTDVLVAMEGPLVGAVLDPQIEGGRYPWQSDIPDSVESIEVATTIPFEAVAALRPDLIVGTWQIEDQATYDRLTEIAPTIPLLGERQVDPWQDIAEAAGEVLGDEDGAQALLDEHQQFVSALADELPGLEGKDYALVNFVAGDALHVVADPEDGASQLFAQLGMEIDPEILEEAAGSGGRLQLSLERADMLDSDLLMLLTNGADPDSVPGYGQLPAVQDDAVALLDAATAAGLNTPTPLSVPWALEQIRPALEAAAG